MASLDAVLFDLDGTLCRRTQDTDTIYARAFDRAGEEPFGEPAALWAALEGPPDHEDRIGYLAAGFARLAARHGRTDVDPIALSKALSSLSDDAAVELTPGAQRALDAAEDRGPIGILTNGPERNQKPKLDALGLLDRMPVVYAGDLPRRKPLSAPFDHALAELGTPAGRTLYVGNSLAYDVAGAQNAGLAVAWLRGASEDPGPYTPEHVLDSLTELPEILDVTR